MGVIPTVWSCWSNYEQKAKCSLTHCSSICLSVQLSNHGVFVVKQIIPKNTFETIPKNSNCSLFTVNESTYIYNYNWHLNIWPIAIFSQSMNQLTFTEEKTYKGSSKEGKDSGHHLVTASYSREDTRWYNSSSFHVSGTAGRHQWLQSWPLDAVKSTPFRR